MTREVFFLASVYHDAVEAGDSRAEELRAQLDAEIEVEYVERRQVHRVARPHFVKVGDPYDYDNEPIYDEADADIENSVRFADACFHFRQVNQMPEWVPCTPARTNLASFDSVLKEHYNAEGIAAWLPASENPLFGMFKKDTQAAVEEQIAELAKRVLETGSKPSRVFMHPETHALLKERDEVEVRMRSYAKIVNHAPNMIADPNCPPNRAYLLSARRETDAVLENMYNQIATDLFRGDDNE